MKKILSVRENIKLLFDFIVKRYDSSKVDKETKISFKLKDGNEVLKFGLTLTKEKIDFIEDVLPNSTVTVECSVNDWLKICSGRLNPVIGAITGKMKFTGDTKALSLISADPSAIIKKVDGINDEPGSYEFKNKIKWSKIKNVLIISGSPRGKNGYTDKLLSILSDGIKSSGVECKTVVLTEKNIKMCNGCWACWTLTSGECVIKDDMAEMKKLLLEADLIIYGFPVYFDGMPAILKNFFDRQTQFSHPYMVPGIYKTRHPRRNKKQQYISVFSTCGFMEIKTFDSIKNHITQICHNAHLGMLDFILFPETSHCMNDPTVHDILIQKTEAIHEAGRQLVENGRIDKKILKIIAKPTIDNKYIKMWRLGANLFWEDKIIEKNNDY